jgi:MFS family permease
MSVYFAYLLSLLNGTAQFAAQLTLSLYALKLGADSLHVGLLAGMFSVFPALLAVNVGKVVDRYGSRWPMMFGATSGGLGLLLAAFVPAMPALYVAALMVGISSILFNLSTQNLVGLLSTPETRPRYFANYTLTISTAQFIGPLSGGLLIDHFNPSIACMGLSAITLLPILLLAVRGSDLPGGTLPTAASASGGIRGMLADPLVQRMLLTGCLLNAGVNMFQVYIPVYGHSIGLSASNIGVVLAMNSAAAFVVRFGLPQLIRRFGEDRILAYAFVMGAVGLLLVPFFHSVVLLALVAFTFGLGMGGGQPIVIMLMFSNSKDGRSAEALGLKFTTNQLTKLVAPMVFGVIASALGLPPMFWLNAGLMAAGGAFSWSHRRPKRKTA